MGNGESLGSVLQTCASDFNQKYSVGKLLGKGSQGRVYSCVHRDTNTECAVKVIDRSAKCAWESYRREVELCRAASSSEHVVQILEEFVDNEYCYVVMEKLEGHLRKCTKWLASQSESEEDLVLGGIGNAGLRRVVHQVLGGVLHLHRAGIVHRDVKAHNILADRVDLRDERLRVVLSDFGLARRLEQGRFLSAQVGTRKYWAPELYDKKYWHAVDVFALGVVMFLMATSTYPFLDEEQTRRHDVTAARRVPESLLTDAKDFMAQAMQKDPEQRPTAHQLARHPWLSCMPGDFGEEEVDDSSLYSADADNGAARRCTSVSNFGPKVGQDSGRRPESCMDCKGAEADFDSTTTAATDVRMRGSSPASPTLQEQWLGMCRLPLHDAAEARRSGNPAERCEISVMQVVPSVGIRYNPLEMASKHRRSQSTPGYSGPRRRLRPPAKHRGDDKLTAGCAAKSDGSASDGGDECSSPKFGSSPRRQQLTAEAAAAGDAAVPAQRAPLQRTGGPKPSSPRKVRLCPFSGHQSAADDDEPPSPGVPAERNMGDPVGLPLGMEDLSRRNPAVQPGPTRVPDDADEEDKAENSSVTLVI